SSALVTVYYASNASRAKISFIDNDTGNTLHVDGLAGYAGDVLNYDPATVIADLQKQGYELVDNGWARNPDGLNQAYFDAYALGETVYTRSEERRVGEQRIRREGRGGREAKNAE